VSEPLYRIAWRNKQTGDTGHGRRTMLRLFAEKTRDAANKQFPETEHWIEEVPVDE